MPRSGRISMRSSRISTRFGQISTRSCRISKLSGIILTRSRRDQANSRLIELKNRRNAPIGGEQLLFQCNMVRLVFSIFHVQTRQPARQSRVLEVDTRCQPSPPSGRPVLGSNWLCWPGGSVAGLVWTPLVMGFIYCTRNNAYPPYMT